MTREHAIPVYDPDPKGGKPAQMRNKTQPRKV
jgi:hypothetical protein